MSAPRCQGLAQALARWIVLWGLSLYSAASYTQVVTTITPDATLPTPSSVAQSGTTFDINAGTAAGGNLFHSFTQFDVGTGATANFNAASGTANILSRVTGGSLSQIDGTLTATDLGTGGLSGANLFLLNPAGILFGKNAQLNLGGSFHATTADYIGLSDGTRFHAVPSGADALLTAAPPSAFGFLSAPPGPGGCPNACIEIQSFAGDGLRVVNGQTLSLVGGPINVGNTSGSAPGRLLALDAGETQVAGRINLVSVAAAGEAAFDGTDIEVDGFAQLGDINIRRGSIIDAREVYIRAGQLQVTNALVFPGAIPVIFGRYTQPNGGEVNVQATDDVTISGTFPFSGPNGDFVTGIRTQSGSDSAVGAPTDAAAITIEAGSVSIGGRAAVRSVRFGPGNAAEITISADTLTISNGGTLNLSNLYAGPGGTITINAQDVDIFKESARLGFTGIAGQTAFHPGWGGGGFSTDPALTAADGGTIAINVSGSLTLRQAEIATESRSLGRSGAITINASDLFLSDDSTIAAQSVIAGDSADVRVNVAGRMDIDGGSRISAATLGSGNGGAAAVSAGQSISLSGEGGGIFGSTNPVPIVELNAFATRALGRAATFADLIADLGLDPATADIFDVLNVLNARGWTAVVDLSPGDAGKVSVTAPQLSLDAGAALSSLTLWDGNAGQIEANIGNVSVQGGAEIRTRSGGNRADNGQVSIGAGNAGTVSLTATDTISVAGAGSAVSHTRWWQRIREQRRTAGRSNVCRCGAGRRGGHCGGRHNLGHRDG
jgi:filamentous hemagglutinin family protein